MHFFFSASAASLFGKSYAKIQMEMQQKKHEKCCKESKAEDKVGER